VALAELAVGFDDCWLVRYEDGEANVIRLVIDGGGGGSGGYKPLLLFCDA
jgi:hypothetical protein